jgi:hypothetical protein
MERRRKLISPSGLTFFGLTSEYRNNLFTQIHNIVFHGKGGYDWHTVYNMPIWLRNFTYQNINEFYLEQKKENEKYSKKKQVQVARPNVKPNYTTKASK